MNTPFQRISSNVYHTTHNKIKDNLPNFNTYLIPYVLPVGMPVYGGGLWFMHIRISL
jgi:hypothetical protein